MEQPAIAPLTSRGDRRSHIVSRRVVVAPGRHACLGPVEPRARDPVGRAAPLVELEGLREEAVGVVPPPEKRGSLPAPMAARRCPATRATRMPVGTTLA